MPNIYISKTLSAMSSTGLGTISSLGVATITFSSNMSSARRIGFWSSATALSSLASVTITGRDETGILISETLIPSTIVNTVTVTTQDFLSVSSIVSSTNLDLVNISVSSLGSSPWKVANTCATPFQIGFSLTYSSSAAAQTFGAVEYTLSDISPIFENLPFIPTPFVSTAISTTGGSTSGKIDFPVTAWRLTIDTTATVPVTVSLAAVPAGLGS